MIGRNLSAHIVEGGGRDCLRDSSVNVDSHSFSGAFEY